MIKSMTAFASAEKTQNGTTVTVEIRTYNSRYLDMALRIPHTYVRLEDRIKTLISQWLARGRIEVHLQIRDTSDTDYMVEIDASKMKALQSASTQLKAVYGVEGDLPMDFLLGAGGVIKLSEPEKDTESCWPVIAVVLLSRMMVVEYPPL